MQSSNQSQYLVSFFYLVLYFFSISSYKFLFILPLQGMLEQLQSHWNLFLSISHIVCDSAHHSLHKLGNDRIHLLLFQVSYGTYYTLIRGDGHLLNIHVLYVLRLDQYNPSDGSWSRWTGRGSSYRHLRVQKCDWTGCYKMRIHHQFYHLYLGSLPTHYFQQ